LRLIAGFEEPTSGEISLNGSSIQHLKPYQRNVTTVFQNYALFPHLTVRDNVEFGLRRRAGNQIRTAFATYSIWCNWQAKNPAAPPNSPAASDSASRSPGP